VWDGLAGARGEPAAEAARAGPGKVTDGPGKARGELEKARDARWTARAGPCWDER